MKNSLLILIVFVIGLSGCTKQIERISDLLITVDLLTTNPGEALSILEHISQPDTSGLKDLLPFESLVSDSTQENSTKAIFDSLLKNTYAYLDTVDKEIAHLYLQKWIREDQLMIRAVAYKYLADQEISKNDYKSAIDYMDHYIALRDSIYDTDQKKIDEVIAQKYDQEKLEAENYVLKLKKAQSQKIYAMIIGALLLLLLLSFYIYRKIINRMVNELIKNRRLVEEYNIQIIENEQIIEKSRKLLAQKDIELHEAKERVDENEKLEVQNQLLKEMVRKKEKVYKQYLEKHKSEYLEEHQELHLRYNRLRRRKDILLEQVIRKNDLLLRFKNAPETKEKFSEKDLEEFLDIINKLYDGFANRLKSKYEELT